MNTSAEVDAYIAAQPDVARGELEKLRALIHAAAPDATEKVSYGMPTYVLAGRHAIYTAAWKKHIGIYPVPTAPEPLESALAPFRAATDTVSTSTPRPSPTPSSSTWSPSSRHPPEPSRRRDTPTTRPSRRVAIAPSSPECQWFRGGWKQISATRRTTTSSGMTAVEFPLYSEAPHGPGNRP